MSASDATVYPVKNQAFRTSFKIASSSTGNPVTGGLTGLGAQISKDGGAFAGTANNPVEIGTSGYGYIDLTAAEMNASMIVLRVYASNANAIEFSKEIPTLLLDTTVTGTWDAQTVKRFEQMVMDVADALIGQNDVSGGVQTVYNRGSVKKFSAPYTESSTGATRSKMQ